MHDFCLGNCRGESHSSEKEVDGSGGGVLRKRVDFELPYKGSSYILISLQGYKMVKGRGFEKGYWRGFLG